MIVFQTSRILFPYIKTPARIVDDRESYGFSVPVEDVPQELQDAMPLRYERARKSDRGIYSFTQKTGIATFGHHPFSEDLKRVYQYCDYTGVCMDTLLSGLAMEVACRTYETQVNPRYHRPDRPLDETAVAVRAVRFEADLIKLPDWDTIAELRK